MKSKYESKKLESEFGLQFFRSKKMLVVGGKLTFIRLLKIETFKELP